MLSLPTLLCAGYSGKLKSKSASTVIRADLVLRYSMPHFIPFFSYVHYVLSFGTQDVKKYILWESANILGIINENLVIRVAFYTLF